MLSTVCLYDPIIPMYNTQGKVHDRELLCDMEYPNKTILFDCMIIKVLEGISSIRDKETPHLISVWPFLCPH
jgi:hypothetical protein